MTNILQLKITLDGIKPPIWRRIQVEDSITFEKLHHVIQDAMGWDNYHLHNFQIDRTTCIEMNEEDIFSGEFPEFNEEVIKLSEFITEEKQVLKYIYDFGDDWEHIIKVEKIFPKESTERKEHLICMKGKRACPPEDSGGIYGYYDLMEIRENENHPDYEEMIVDWLGEDYDPEEFNIDEINNKFENLKKIIAVSNK